MARPISEADYLRGELIRARSILASAAGVLEAAETIAPKFASIPTVVGVLHEIRDFQSRQIAVLPKGVRPNA